LVCLSQTVATVRAFSGGKSDRINRDFLGLGASNLLAGIFGTFPVDASPARTAIVRESRGKTQLTALLAAAGVLVLIPFTFLLTNIPLACLAGVLIWVALRIFRYRDLRVILHFDRWEFALSLATLLIVAFIGVQVGIIAAIALAIADRSRLSARPHTYLLGRIDDTTSWAPLGTNPALTQVPGVVVFLFAAPLYFANASTFAISARAALEQCDSPALFVLDAAAIGDIDFTASQALAHLLDDLTEEQVVFAVARAAGSVPTNLVASGLLARIGADHVFESVDEAVRALAPH
jgi:MFS superfamily sulfate permease-like transporter